MRFAVSRLQNNEPVFVQNLLKNSEPAIAQNNEPAFVPLLIMQQLLITRISEIRN